MTVLALDVGRLTKHSHGPAVGSSGWEGGARQVEVACLECQRPFLKYRSAAVRTTRHFCSRACQMANRASHGTAVPSNVRLPDGIDAAGVEWRTIPSAPNYQASDTGLVRRSAAGRSNAIKLGKLMSAKVYKGYRLVTVVKDDGPITIGVHRLVCEAFHGVAPSTDHVTAHWDGTRDNNKSSNLRWATHVENSADMERHGTRLRGEKAGSSKFTDADIQAIRAAYPQESQERLAKRFGTTQSHIGRIVRREVWAHLP